MSSTSKGCNSEYAYFQASWADGDVVVGIKVKPEDWRSIMNGDQVSLRGGYYFYEGSQYGSLWEFSGGLDGDLTISYHPAGDELDIGDGYIGTPRSVLIRPLST